MTSLERPARALSAAALLALALASPTYAASASARTEISNLDFVFGGAGGYLDAASVSQDYALTYGDVTLQSDQGSDLAPRALSYAAAHADAALRWGGDAMSSALDVSGWPDGVSVDPNDARPFLRAGLSISGDVHLAPHASVELRVDWRTSSSSTWSASDSVVTGSGTGLSANFSGADFAFVPSALSYYHAADPGETASFADSHAVVWRNDGDDWASARFELRTVADGWAAAPIPPVPEPSTWALMLAGLAALGQVARRRRAVR